MRRLLASTRFWIVCFLLLILVSIGAILYFKTSANGTVAVIMQDNAEINRIALDSVNEPYTMRIDNKDGGYNVILVEHGKISVIEASCPDGVCIHQGAISDDLMPIVCLPNKLSITIEKADSELSADAWVE